eukprot:3497250-Amphidinium_carterae.2
MANTEEAGVDVQCDTKIADSEDNSCLDEQSNEEFVEQELETQRTALPQAQCLLALRLTYGRPTAKDLAAASSLRIAKCCTIRTPPTVALSPFFCATRSLGHTV